MTSRAQRPIVMAGLIAITIALCGCSALLGSNNGVDRAREEAHNTASEIATAINGARLRNVLASDLAYRYSDASNAPAIDDSGVTNAQRSDHTTVTALSWDGMTRDDNGARLVLQIAVHKAVFRSGTLTGPSYSAGDWSGCFAYTVRAFFDRKPASAHQVDCPEDNGSPVIPPPSPAPVPALPDNAEELLKAVLAGATKQSLSTDLEAAFPDGSIRSDPVTGAQLVRDSGTEIMEEGVVLAVAVGITTTTDCFVGKRGVDGTVSVWHPASVTLRPGETGCTASNALHPVTAH